MNNAIIIDMDTLIFNSKLAEKNAVEVQNDYEGFMSRATDFNIDPIGTIYANACEMAPFEHIIFMTNDESRSEEELTEFLQLSGYTSFDKVVNVKHKEITKAEFIEDTEAQYGNVVLYNNEEVAMQVAKDLH